MCGPQRRRRPLVLVARVLLSALSVLEEFFEFSRHEEPQVFASVGVRRVDGKASLFVDCFRRKRTLGTSDCGPVTSIEQRWLSTSRSPPPLASAADLASLDCGIVHIARMLLLGVRCICAPPQRSQHTT